jgi:hypothetical protein
MIVMRRIGSSVNCTNARHAIRIDGGTILQVCAAVVGMALLGLAGGAAAYSQYSVNKDATNCRGCHGDFRSSPYISLADGQSWGDDLHDVHRTVMLNGDCDTCHSTGPPFPVLLGSSAGGTGLDPVSCSGCHGRLEDGTGVGTQGYGAGLRQHHWVSSVTVCIGCHADANPDNYLPVDEDILPLYYATSDPAHPLIPGDPCNVAADGFLEDYAGSTIGLDNDGDNAYDEADLIPCPEPGSSLMLASGFGLLMLIGRRRMR